MKRLNVGSSFIGWDKIEKLSDSAENDLYNLLLLTIFKTGGRTSEVLSLQLRHFDFNSSKYSIIIKDMPVLKKFDKILKETLPNGKKIYEGSIQKKVYRTFPILRDERFSEYWEHLIKNMSPKKGFIFHYSYNLNRPITRQLSLFYIKTKIGAKAHMKINDHWLRGQRVAQLKSEYGFNGPPLNEWIGWSAQEKGLEMQTRYGKLGWKGLEFELLDGKLRREKVYEMIENR